MNHLRILFLGCILILLGMDQTATAQRNRLDILGSPGIHLDPMFAYAGAETAVATDESTIISWTDPKKNTKISVSTFSPGQKFSLSVEAINSKNGLSAGVVQLYDTMNDQDLVIDIHNNRDGYATLRYKTEVRIEQGNTETEPADVHSVTYTITNQ